MKASVVDGARIAEVGVTAIDVRVAVLTVSFDEPVAEVLAYVNFALMLAIP